MDHLFLVNNHTTPLIINMAIHRSIKSTTLRHRTVPVALTLPRGGLVDICKLYNITKAEAKEIVAQTADIQNFIKKGKLLSIVDPDVTRNARIEASLEGERKSEARAASKAAKKALTAEERRHAREREEAEKELVRKTNAAREREAQLSYLSQVGRMPVEAVDELRSRKAAEKAKRKENVVDTTEPFDETQTSSADGTVALETENGVKFVVSAAVENSMPSTKWTLEKLKDFASTNGITFPTDTTKNKLLRLIRDGGRSKNV